MNLLIERLKERAKDPYKYKSMATQVKQAEKIFGKNRYGYSSEIPLPATLEQVQVAEQELGFNLPNLLKEIYLQVANGGFGPGYGILGLPPNGATDDNGETALSLYGVLPINDVANPNYDDPEYEFLEWPEGLLPICYYGCSIYDCLDCTEEFSKILTWDSGNFRDKIVANSLEQWLENWLST